MRRVGADPRRRDRRTTRPSEIARRSRGTPRIANRILRRVRDVAEVRHAGRRHDRDRRGGARRCSRSTSAGLERFDRELLRCVVEKFGGGPVGLSTLAVALGEEADTIEDVYEPYLLQLGFLQRTPRGRIVTELGRAHLGARRGLLELVLASRPTASSCPRRSTSTVPSTTLMAVSSSIAYAGFAKPAAHCSAAAIVFSGSIG